MASEALVEWGVRRFGRGGALTPLARALMARTTGMQQVFTRRASVTAVLGLDGVTVPYGPPSEPLGLGAFPLSLDGASHQAARERVATALEGSAAMHEAGVAAAAKLAAQLVPPSRPDPLPFEAVSGLIDPCLRRWVDTWFGLPLDDPALDLAGASRLVTASIFLNPAGPKGAIDAGLPARAVAAADRLCAELVDRLSAPAEVAPGTLARELLRSLPAEEAARHLIGLTVGPLALGSWALTNAVFDLVSAPPGIAGLTDPQAAATAFTGAIARRPPLPWLPRVNPRERQVLGCPSLVSVPAGEVLAATACAAELDPPTDATAPPLVFGAGPHRCMGSTQIAEVAGVVLAALAPRRPAVPEGAAGSVQTGRGPTGRSWSFPASLTITFAPQP